MLTLSEVGKSFGGRTLFEDVSLQVNREDRIGLVGPNGAGKSTLFSIILQTESPDEGQVNFQRGVSVGFLAKERLFRNVVGEDDRSIDECKQSEVIGLKVVVDERMIVTLGALQIHPEKNATDIARHDMRFSITVEEKLCCGTKARINSVCRQYFTGQSIERNVVLERRLEILLPLGRCHVFVWTPLHQHDIERTCHVDGKSGAGHQSVNQRFAFV